MGFKNIFTGQVVLVTLSLFLHLLLLHCNQVQSVYNREEFKKIVFNDSTNDDAIYMNAQELLKRSGYEYEEFWVKADDGYITQLVRIINPLADREQLKKPPVLLYHGGNIDMSCYLIASSIQHHPEKYPRTQEDGPITSSSRSLGFTLANNGFDVWLVGTRGSNTANEGHVLDYELSATSFDEVDLKTRKQPPRRYAKTKMYWEYGLDDVIQYEIKHQIDKVLEVTGSEEFFLFSYSLSTPTTMAFLGLNPDYAKRARVYFQMGPSVNAGHFTTFDRLYFEDICVNLPTRGKGFTPTYLGGGISKSLVLVLSKSMKLRYSFLYDIIIQLFGPSPKYQSNLERNLLSHAFQPVSFKSVQQYCQGSAKKKLQKFDYGHEKNLKIYGQLEPPAYDISYIDAQNYVIITGTNDALAGPTTTQRILETTKSQKPIVSIEAPEFNHLDLIGGVESDKYVNLPIVETLNQYSS